MTAPLLVSDSALLRHCGFVLAKLRRYVEAWQADDDVERLLKIAGLGFVANASLLTRELTTVLSSYTCTALLLRTLWHNAGELAWLLNGPGDLTARLDAFRADHDTRAEEALLDRPIHMFGHTVAASQLSTPELRTSAAVLRSQAKDASEHSRAMEDRGEAPRWSQIGVGHLWKAMRRSFHVAKRDLGDELETVLRYSEDAVGAGDDIAHPNSFVMFSILGLVDLDALRVQRQLSPPEWRASTVLFQAGNLLVAHGVAIYAHDKTLFPLPVVLEGLGSSLARSG